MSPEDVSEVVQEVVEKELSPVKFGSLQRFVLWAILTCSAVSAVASVATVVVLAL